MSADTPGLKVIIVDPRAVPPVWCEPNMKAIEAFAREVIREKGLDEGRKVLLDFFGLSVIVEATETRVG